MRTVIAGGAVVTEAGVQSSDVVCDGEQIVELTAPQSWGPDTTVVDATGKVVLPGFIDPHVHSRDPGQTDKEDFEHATRAAAAGGITTILDMPNTSPAITDAAILRQRADSHQAVAHIDFGLWGLMVGRQGAGEIADLANAGAVGLKIFWGYYFDAATGRLIHNVHDADRDVIGPASIGDLWGLLAVAAQCQAPVAIHCEDRTVLDTAARKYPPAEDYLQLLEARPAVAESVAIAAAIELARDTGARVHIVHVSTRRATDLIRRAHDDGVQITAETCPHYLTLTADDFETVGPAMKVYPPIRHREDQDALWASLRDGTLAFVASDHAPHSELDRSLPFAQQPAGAVSVETMAPLMLDQVARGRISIERLAQVLSTSAARTFGIYPRKGTIAPGSDADFTIVDLSKPWKISNDRLHSKSRVSPWHGRTGIGAPTTVILRGRVIAKDGTPTGDPSGRFIASSRAVSQGQGGSPADVAGD